MYINGKNYNIKDNINENDVVKIDNNKNDNIKTDNIEISNVVNYYNIRIFLKAFDFIILDELIFKFIKLCEELNIKFIGPVCLPVKKKRFNILRSPHVNKKSRDQLEISIYKKFIDFHHVDKSFILSVKKLYEFYNIDFYFEILY